MRPNIDEEDDLPDLELELTEDEQIVALGTELCVRRLQYDQLFLEYLQVVWNLQKKEQELNETKKFAEDAKIALEDNDIKLADKGMLIDDMGKEIIKNRDKIQTYKNKFRLLEEKNKNITTQVTTLQQQLLEEKQKNKVFDVMTTPAKKRKRNVHCTTFKPKPPRLTVTFDTARSESSERTVYWSS